MLEPASKPSLSFTLHHMKLAAASVPDTLKFYTEILPFTAVPSLDHYTADGVLYGAIFALNNSENTPGVEGPESKLLVEVRENKPQALSQKGWDPVTWGVPGLKDLEAWVNWFDAKGVKHSKVLRGVLGWTLVAEDPDGKFIKIYTTKETHDWNVGVDQSTTFLLPFPLLLYYQIYDYNIISALDLKAKLII
ncbi:hypothetical protein BJ170DRAFT_682063 [Xylariales sp. AK1849]|nr:hypothetical protein BJ170DRAFT_682063 [Xylariales sp. AK1849]